MPHIELLSSVNPSGRGTSATSSGKTTHPGSGDDAAISFDSLLGLGLISGETPIEESTERQIGGSLSDKTEMASAATLPAAIQAAGTPVQDTETSAQVSEIVDAAARAKTTHASLLRDPRESTGLNQTGQALGTDSNRTRAAHAIATDANLQAASGDTRSIQERLPTAITPLHADSANPATTQQALSQGLDMLTRTTQSPTNTQASTVAVPERIGTSAWSDSFAQRIVVIAGRNEQVAEIRLNPPHLGPIEVSIAMAGEEQRNTNLHFSAQQATVREAIENALPRLREMFEQAGIALGNATVGSEASSHRQSQTDEDGTAPGTAQEPNPAVDAKDGKTARPISMGGVDTFA